ncbi:MAG: cob(I)yrinic acid a,c-diamide adenosyltransferase [Bacteroidetes bacterium]|nr:cob(I)yrinic acid a,c-diamide adenosyltransferase [Bacteroidota bacterium]MBU1578166.1 cob(I)yrinic acid a,c-diamide adenosyltransferase [Bacteroidota bacterium]
MIQLYTGNGKGKTTAALGAAVRAAGSGMRVFIAQFVKGMPYGELTPLKAIPEIQIQQFGRDCFIKNKPVKADIDAAQAGWEKVKSIISENKTELLILDELCIAIHYNLIAINEVIETLRSKPPELELVITGRYAQEELIEIADLVTEMQLIKHYYDRGIQARKGIEY